MPNKYDSIPTPRHDPNAEGALVMKRPRFAPPGKQIVDVVVDPKLTKLLRKYQRAGVAFLYECVMGMKEYNGQGAILADEMGLGKTLQTIALLWTLLKQNPIYGDSPVIRKALIVCPVSVIENWRKEFRKFLGRDQLGIFVLSNNNMRLTDFTHGSAYSVMIVGYEKLRLIQAELQKGLGIDIVIADEGHRLKTAQNKSALAIKALNTEKRIILSGTPIQNDLTEFYTMADFVNPGLLGKYSTFKREFEIPILRSRQPEASANDVEKGKARSEELANITAMFVLRRTAEKKLGELPPRTEYVLFCRPTETQAAIYRAIIRSSYFNAALDFPALSLELINVLKKVCNSPTLLKAGDKSEGIAQSEFMDHVSPTLLRSPGSSGKLQVLDSLLHQIRTTSDEKVVLVSNYTSTMDVLANLLASRSYRYLRLDGSTPPGKRQELVDRFNCSHPTEFFVFLLSAKAGGTGLNLTGASRLVLFDLDWNPATDLQAMARIHRIGQKRPCFFYRLLTQGALDEKIFQRQVSKTGLSDSIIDSKTSVSSFSHRELRDLFSLDESDDCQTHKLLACKCGGKGILDPDLDDELMSPRNDLASLCVENAELIEVDSAGRPPEGQLEYDSDGDPILYKPKPKLPTGNQVDILAQEDEIKRRSRERMDSNNKNNMPSLMQYAHFDTAVIDSDKLEMTRESVDEDETLSEFELSERYDTLKVAIEDGILRNVLLEIGRKIGFVFTKTKHWQLDLPN
ncbi:hypothetical protein M433DRAFT_169712 [Acidomyces richmondensis BFW]|nr:hypothetical protein M433DRAFT_169712 [Acidomyces richmondensis BFW]